MDVLRVKHQIKPFLQKSTKVYVPFTEHPLLCRWIMTSLIWLVRKKLLLTTLSLSSTYRICQCWQCASP